MSHDKTPYEMWTELRDLVMALEKDAQKATRGMKAGGVRLRALLQQVREHCVDMRKAVLDYRTTRRPRHEVTDQASEMSEMSEMSESSDVATVAPPNESDSAVANIMSNDNTSNDRAANGAWHASTSTVGQFAGNAHVRSA